MHLAFFHDQECRQTICLELPAIAELESCKLRQHIWLNIGVAKVSPKDRYVKKIGRELSESRLKPIKLMVTQMLVGGDKDLYCLRTEDVSVSVVLRHKPGTSILHVGSVTYAN